jgi:hypothetical protein
MLENTEGVIEKDNPEKLPLRYSLTCICPVSCVPNVASFSGLSFLITPSVFSNMYLSCVLEKLATLGTQDTGQINIREYRRGNKKKDNPEKLATLGTQDTGQINAREYRRGNKKGQSSETGNIRYTRHRTIL